MRSISPEVRHRILKTQAAVPLIFALAGWGVYAVNKVFGFRFGRFRNAEPAEVTLVLFIGAIAITLIAVIVFFIQCRRALYLARHGIEVEGQITSVSPKFQHMRRIGYAYKYEGKIYEKAFSDGSDLYESGQQLVVVIDPANPSRAMRKDEIILERRGDKDSPG